MGMFAVIVDYRLSFTNQEKQTSVFSFLCMIILFFGKKTPSCFEKIIVERSAVKSRVDDQKCVYE
jgi:hypothetical protein